MSERISLACSPNRADMVALAEAVSRRFDNIDAKLQIEEHTTETVVVYTLLLVGYNPNILAIMIEYFADGWEEKRKQDMQYDDAI